MGRPRIADRSTVVGKTLTLRLTAEERGWLKQLVTAREADLAEQGGRVSKASLVRGLIRAEARAKGLLDEPKPRRPKR